tara:strand:- start:79 stop:966 length:888 start_codon:yes stop_codon:yes gene_type:complete
MNVDTVVIPVAGLGTRMLPATKAIPKEMLPIVDKPIIQLIVEEAVKAKFKKIIFITHSSKNSIENHFDKSFELEAALEKRLKRVILKEIKQISKLNVIIQSIRQGEAKGLGHAILCAKSIIKKDPFAVMLPDMLLEKFDDSENLNLSHMKFLFERDNQDILLIGKAKKKEIPNYGIVELNKFKKNNREFLIENIVEKPSIKRAPSSYFVVGRYIFNNKFLNYLENLLPDKSGELQLTDGIKEYLKNKNIVKGLLLDGKSYDCGNKIDYLKANVEFAIKDSILGKEFLKFLKEKTK